MIQTGFESRVKVQQIIENQFPEFILDESPKTVDFFKQYYISQEYQGGPVDIAENLDQYLKLDNLTPEVVVGSTTLLEDITDTTSIIVVSSTKGFPNQYGLLKIDDEIITYTGITTNSFTGCIRGFSGITTYHSVSNSEELVFSTSLANSHSENATVQNLSSLFLKEFYKKLKFSLTPGLDDVDFVSDLNVGNFIKNARAFYQSKGTNESFRILFNVLYGVTPRIINLEDLLLKPSSANYVRREVIVVEAISGDPYKLIGQTIKKSTDDATSASVSEVEIITRQGKTYYKISLFIGYNDSSSVTGTFAITPSSRVLETTSIGSSIISVDSTIGFPSSGTLISGNNTITYTDKSINQFFGCSGISEVISTADLIRSTEVYYGYEDGDTDHKVELRTTGVLSDLIILSDDYVVDENENIYVKNVGEVIKNPDTGKTYKQILSNSWIYNTSSRYQIKSISGADYFLFSKIDPSSLKVNDKVEILNRNTQQVVSSSQSIPVVQSVDLQSNKITLGNLGGFVPPSGNNQKYDLRRKVNKAQSSGVPIEFGNSKLISDVQNTYVDNDNYFYTASNSLPSYSISKSVIRSTLLNASGTSIQGFDPDTQGYSTISFDSPVSFITGDSIYYEAESTPITGLTSGGIYYVEVGPLSNQIKLFTSRSFIGGDQYVTLYPLGANSGKHYFTLYSQKDNQIGAQKLLKKFILDNNIQDGNTDLTIAGSTGMLINGVEISNYKSDDKVYYGPLESVDIINGGEDYDVINPPLISISSGSALIQPVIKGSVKKIFVDPQEFDVNSVVSIAITGGNGSGAIFEPVIQRKRREIEFDARQSTNSGGIDIVADTLTFSTNHKLSDGEAIVYNSNGNSELGIGNFNSSNLNTGKTLKTGTVYYPQIVNNTTIKLYDSLLNFTSGINTIGFTTANTAGIHKFETFAQRNNLIDIKVVDGGSGYENRKLIINPSTSGISTVENTVSYKNHNFNDGDLISYEYQTSAISGLSTSNQYYVLKLDDDSFRLSDAGIGGTNRTNYLREKYVKFATTGSGYQTFKYPDINVSVQYSVIGSNVGNTFTATPIVRGSIVDAYIYEKGSNYGSTILNLHKKPLLSIKNGRDAQLNPIIVNGKIISVNVQYGGSEYYSIPDLVVVSETGSGAVLRPVIADGKIINVIVINPGIDYDSTTTSIRVDSAGSKAILNSNIRSLTVNYQNKFGNELLKSTDNSLQYSICGYFNNLRSYFNDSDQNTHSPIIGWAYDGNPIYGGFGYSDPQDSNSGIKILQSGYELTAISNRPSGFDDGFFVEDYEFTNSGDLDQNNGRFCKTPEFPNGIYAYFATLNANNLTPSFPYFIGNSYRSNFISDNSIINQDFDFNNSSLIRNTLPYKVSDDYAGNDFIVESNEIVTQRTNVESVTKGNITSLEIISSGDNYKINDSIVVDNANTNGSGLDAIVSSLTGKDIVSLDTTVETYQNAIFTWKDGNQIQVTIQPYHNLSDGDNVVISGLTTTLSQINKLHKIGISSYIANLIKDIPSNVGVVTDIYLSQIPDSISIGSSIKIESETLSVLNIFPTSNILRVKRGSVGTSHSTSAQINFVPDSFTISEQTDYFKSKLKQKAFFNPVRSVGVGQSVGISSTINIVLGSNTFTRQIQTQSIYIENHGFSDNEKVIFTKPNGYASINVTSVSGGTQYNLPSSGNSQEVYITKKTKDTIGIKTQLTSSELFFVTNGDNNYEYSVETIPDQILGRIQKIKSTVSISTSHSLESGDKINLQVKPNLSVGIGTSVSIYVKFDTSKQKLLINPLGFSSTGINTTSNILTINSHNLNTGDKILYSSTDSVASGLSNYGSYYAYKIDENSFKLCETYLDSKTNPPTTISIASTGGRYQQIAAINPKIEVIKNNNLVFNLSDSSLSGYKFKLFYDNGFNDEFVSTGTTSIFSVYTTGTIGASNAQLTLNYSSDLPNTLFYTLEKTGYVTGSDSEVFDGSKITFVDSTYNGSYTISGVGTTTFNISLEKSPEKLNYTQDDCEVLKYSTSSLSANGGIDKLRILSTGTNYKNIPVITNVESLDGNGAYIVARSNNVGKVNQIKFTNESYEYSSDNTLRPTAYIPPEITLDSSNILSTVEVLSGGKNYTFAPNLIVVDTLTGNKINSGFLEANLTSNTIGSVNIIDNPKGLPSLVNIIATNNSNGIAINTIESSSSGIVTCYLVTPINGFTTPPFAIGDKIFVENIIKSSTSGTGFNSQDYGYVFFTVTNFSNTIPAKLEYNLHELTLDPGTAKSSQNSFASIINYTNYPIFNVTLTHSDFEIGEQILSDIGNGFVMRDLYVSLNNDTNIKVFGSYDLSIGEFIKGSKTGNVAKVNAIKDTFGQFKVNYSVKQNFGWSDEVGKLDEDHQVISDNDYYQNLSYTIKSPITYETLITPVNNLVHTSGLKNFADTEIISTVSVGIISDNSSSVRVYDILDEKRVDTINIFDLTKDINTVDSQSKFLKLKNKKLSSYISCITNRVLRIDDISANFSSSNSITSDETTLLKISSSDSYNRFLVQITSTDQSEIQLTDVTVLNDGNNLFTVENSTVTNTEYTISDISGDVDIDGNGFLKFTPSNGYDKDYDIKLLRDNFNTNLSGIGTTSVGFIDLTGSNKNISSGVTTSIISVSTNKFSSLYSNVQIINSSTNQMNFVELYLTHDGTNTYISEYYFDSNPYSSSGNYIGSFSANISSGILSLNYNNTTNNQIILRSKIVGFGTTAVGSGIYRFKTSGQLDDTEETATYTSSYANVSSASTIISLDKNTFSSLKAIVRVSVGSTSALHQVSLVHDNTNIKTLQYPFISVGSTTGIGTFGGDYSGSNVTLNFYPDPGTSGTVNILTFSENFYTTLDTSNIPEDLSYGSITNTFDIAQYNSINGDRIQRLNFDLNYQGYPIFKKVFNPSNSTVLNPSTGEFTIVNHFFSDGEQLTYTPKSTFVGIGQSAMRINGVTTLPSTVYVHKLSNDVFKLATTKSNALSGICVTFTSYGLGNAHELEMNKKLERSIITIDNLVQYPITYTPISYTLSNNGGQISSSRTAFALSGISSIKSEDILKIDNEYMKVTNVGLGTTNSGPITNTGTIPLVEVTRGFVGSSATSHTDSTISRVYRGSYNIVGNQIYFTQPPTGNNITRLDSSNLSYPRSEFTGRVFLRNDYTTNQIYDNISDKFTGIGQTYTLTVSGINTVGLGISGGNGIVFVNSIFQAPTTQNNSDNNFSIIENTSVGISSIVFTGITSDNGSIVKSIDDVNQNQLPRGGLIVSLGSTNGLGYAPLVGASVTAVVSGGSIISVGRGSTDILGSGYYGNVSIGVSDPTGINAIVTASVGAGGTLSFTVVNGGSGYTNPRIITPSPTYSNLPVIGVSRLGVGSTTATGTGLLVNVSVDAASTTGIGSTLFEITRFSIARSGYGFNKGDVIKPVGLVTAKGLSSPVNEFQLTVLDTFTDSFASWQFGELDYIDSIKNLQDGVRVTFPLYYNSDLLSFETDYESGIDLNSVLLIFINGVIQDPGSSYNFDGGSTFQFSVAPRPEDNISIFFYRGSRNIDSVSQNVYETIKVGDTVQVHQSLSNLIPEQNIRTVYNLSSSDILETDLYAEQGIDILTYRPFSWNKQKVDKKINEQFVYKTRDSLESVIYPTAKVINDFSVSDTTIFTDNAEFFNWENPASIEFDALIVQDTTPIAIEKIAGVTAVTGFSGIITGITTTSGIGAPLALKFYLNSSSFASSQLTVGCPIYIFNTNVGKGVTSITTSDSSKVGIGTTFLDNIYYINSYSDNGSDKGTIICNILSTTSTLGLSTSGSNVGQFSWGKMSGFTRSSSPVSIAVTGKRVDVGLTTFPTIQRRGYGLRDTGGLKKII